LQSPEEGSATLRVPLLSADQGLHESQDGSEVGSATQPSAQESPQEALVSHGLRTPETL
jgi:hypothetical protein